MSRSFAPLLALVLALFAVIDTGVSARMMPVRRMDSHAHLHARQPLLPQPASLLGGGLGGAGAGGLPQPAQLLGGLGGGLPVRRSLEELIPNTLKTAEAFAQNPSPEGAMAAPQKLASTLLARDVDGTAIVNDVAADVLPDPAALFAAAEAGSVQDFAAQMPDAQKFVSALEARDASASDPFSGLFGSVPTPKDVLNKMPSGNDILNKFPSFGGAHQARGIEEMFSAIPTPADVAAKMPTPQQLAGEAQKFLPNLQARAGIFDQFPNPKDVLDKMPSGKDLLDRLPSFGGASQEQQQQVVQQQQARSIEDIFTEVPTPQQVAAKIPFAEDMAAEAQKMLPKFMSRRSPLAMNPQQLIQQLSPMQLAKAQTAQPQAAQPQAGSSQGFNPASALKPAQGLLPL